ncbi:MAG TPA: murein biosynthesis integral membrane protein MurJ [Gammaproteobacteria bacterium]|nr:murein biosynthesis integral membrane protein MurJ [Gammaproteobacteria bacterium]
MSRALFKATSLVGGMTLVSRILGFARDMMLARYFGAGMVMDAFTQAFKIPNFGRRTFGEGAFSLAFVPVLSEYKATRSQEEVKLLTDRVAGSLALVLFGVTLVGVIGAPVVMWIFAPGFSNDPDKYALAVRMLRVTFPYLMFISLTAMAGGILNTYSRFWVPAFTPVLLNVTMILAIIYLAPHLQEPGMALAWGVFIAGVIQLGFQLPFLAQIKLLPRPRLGETHEAVTRIMKLMLPAVFGSSVQQVNLVVDSIIASFLATGSVSWLYYADRMLEFPLGVFSIALGTVILPNLAQHYALKNSLGFSATLDWALRLTVVVVLPAAMGMLVFSGPLLATLFDYGKFDAHDTTMATWALTTYSSGLLSFTLVKVLVPGFYSRHDSRTPVRIGVMAVLANFVLNMLITVPWARAGYMAPHAGIALSTSLAAFLNAWLLYRELRKTGVYAPTRGWSRLLLRVMAANLVMGAVLYFGAGDLASWMAQSAWHRIAHLAVWILGAMAIYFGTLFLAGFRLGDLRVKGTHLPSGATPV